MVALFLQAYMHNFNIVYITLFVVFSLATSGCYFGRVNLYYLELVTLPQGRIFANLRATLRWRLINRAKNPAYDLTLHCADTTEHFKSIDKEALLTLTPVFEKRGDMPYPEVLFESRFPLLHVRFLKTQKFDQTLCVYPEPKGVSLEQYLKEQPSSFGERDDFEGLRTYENSDIPSLIHWPSLAKGGEMMSRNFSFTTQLETLHFDFLSCGESDEARLSQLSLWVLECEKQRRDFTITMPHEYLDSKKESSDAILQKLARY
jgi:uncharacterized protein (DUF58 family)